MIMRSPSARKTITQLASAICLALCAPACAQTPPAAAARASAPAAPAVRPAIEGILEAFDAHPLVGVNGNLELAQAADFYAALIRDPRFARQIGNVVVEFGGAAHQDIIDRYVAGEAVPYADLRKVWSGLYNGGSPAITNLGFMNFYAEVRATNLALPPDQRIRVWLGEPPIDWSQVRTRADLAAVEGRDAHAAGVIERNILALNRKALVIYGGAHFDRASAEETAAAAAWRNADPRAPMPSPNLRELIEARHPGVFFTVRPYDGFAEKACSEAFEASLAAWPAPALVSPVRGSTLEAALRRRGCSSGARMGGAPPGVPAAVVNLRMARTEDRALGLTSDAILYLGHAASLMRSPTSPDVYLDLDYRRELSRRNEIITGRPLPAVRVQDYAATPRTWRGYDAAEIAARDEVQRAAAFSASDRNGDGRLDKAEYRDVLISRGYGEQLDALFQQRDANRDGFVSADEYRAPIPQ
jgi:hypothetical protein